MYRLWLVILLALAPISAQATIYWDSEMEESNHGFDSEMANHIASGAYSWDTTTFYSGTGSLRYNFPAQCQNLEFGGAGCGGFSQRTFPTTDDLYTRMYWRQTGTGPNATPSGTFEASMGGGTKMFQHGSTGLPRVWIAMRCCGKAGKTLTLSLENSPMPPPVDTTNRDTSFYLADNTPSRPWYCIETRLKLNTPGVANGIIQVWVDGVLVLNRSDYSTRAAGDNSLWQFLRVYRQTARGNAWIDRLAAGNERIGCIGSPSPPDTTPPPAPILTTNVSGTTVTGTWPAVTDPSGIASYSARWCQGTSCGPTTPLTTVGSGTLTFQHSGLANATVYGYCLLATDGAPNANSSPCSTPTQYETTESPPAPPAPPTIVGLTGTPTSLTVTPGTVVPSFVRIQLGDNAGNFTSNIEYPWSDFVNGVLSVTIPAGTQYTCAWPRDADHLENVAGGAYRCIGAISGVPPVDTNPIVMGAPFPAAPLPAGTTSSLYGVPLDKPGNCRADTGNRAYVAMDVEDTAVQLTVSNLQASGMLGSLTNGSSTTLYIQCEFVNTFSDSYYTTTAVAVTIAVDTETTDTTPPGVATDVQCSAVAGTTNVNCTWVPPADLDIDFYRLYLATGACSSYTFSGTQLTETVAFLSLLGGTDYCVKIEVVDTSGNPSELSTAGTVATSTVLDVEPPSDPAGFQVDQPFTGSVVTSWDTCTDRQGPCFTDVQFCQGIGCTNWTSPGGLTGNSSLTLNLSAGLFYRFRIIHRDQAGNPSGGHGTPTYSDIVEFTTAATGLAAPRPLLNGTVRPSGAVRPPNSATRPARPLP